MKKKIQRIWVSDDFAKFIKIQSANNGKNIIDYSKELVNELEDKKIERKNKYGMDFRF